MLIYTIIALVLGAVAGIIINYLADVLPYTRRFSAQVCLECGHRFTLRESLFSFRCPECKTGPRSRYFLVVIGMMGLSILAAIFPIQGVSYWAVMPVLTFLGLIMIIDLEHRIVLNETSVFGGVLLLIVGIFRHGLWNTLLGGVAGFGAMLILYYGGILFTRLLSRLRHQEIDEVALGFGDVNVAGFLGLLVGWPAIGTTLVLAILLGGVVSLLVIVGLAVFRRYRAFTAIPYAPFLIIAAGLVLFLA